MTDYFYPKYAASISWENLHPDNIVSVSVASNNYFLIYFKAQSDHQSFFRSDTPVSDIVHFHFPLVIALYHHKAKFDIHFIPIVLSGLDPFSYPCNYPLIKILFKNINDIIPNTTGENYISQKYMVRLHEYLQLYCSVNTECLRKIDSPFSNYSFNA